jgi:hypothetical protein
MGLKISRFALPLLLVGLGAGGIAEAAEKYQSIATSYEMSLDGNPIDWEAVPITYLEESLHVMSLAHDEENLYIMFRFADERLARELMRRGVTLWINGDGNTKKKKEEFAVRYPGSEQISEYLKSEDNTDGRTQASGSDPSGRRAPPPELASLRQLPGHLTVIRDGIKEMTNEDEAGGPAAGSRFDDGSFCYELRVPFADIGGKVADTNPSKKRGIAVGIQIGGLTHAEMEMVQSAMRERMGDMGGMGGGRGGGGTGGMGGMSGGRGGMGGMGGTGSGRGGGTGGGDGRRRGLDPEIEWLSVTLVPAS